MDRVDAIEGAGVGCSANLRVSLQCDHIEGTTSFSFFGDAESNANKTATAPMAKGMKSTSRLVGLAAEVIVSTSNNRRLRALYTRESPIKSSLLNQPRPLGEIKKINRMIRYNSAEICAREETRPVGVKCLR
jgi:hypothetical protein